MGLFDYIGGAPWPVSGEDDVPDVQQASKPAAPQINPAALQALNQASPQQPSGGFQGFLSDPERMARLAIGLNSLRMRPDSGLAESAMQDIKDIRDKRKSAEANKYFAALAAQGQDIRALIPKMMETPEGRAALAQYSTIMPALRKAGMMGDVYDENPFNVYMYADSPNVKKLATQYSQSYQKGLIDPEAVDKRVEALSKMQSAWDDKRNAEIQRKHEREVAALERRSLAEFQAGLRPERTVTVMDEDGNPYTVGESEAVANKLERYSPAASKAKREKASQTAAKSDMNDMVNGLAASYKKLGELGGIGSTKQGWVASLASSARSSGPGQILGGAFKTEEQSLRNDILMARPQLTAIVQKASGMSSQQLNSNMELQQFMKTATDPSVGLEENYKALERLDKRFGLGLFSAEKFGAVKQANPFK